MSHYCALTGASRDSSSLAIALPYPSPVAMLRGNALFATIPTLHMHIPNAPDPDAPPRKGNKGRPPRGTRPPSAAVVEQRILQVLGLITAGQRTSQVYRSVATLQRREQMDRAKAIQRKEPPVAFVWGDKPCPTRTIDRYIQRAKEQLRTDARALPRSADYILGMQWSRINDLYNAARQAAKFTVCVDLIEIVNSMFGLNAAIRLQFGEAEAGSDLAHLPTAKLTRSQAHDALGSLMRSLQHSGEALIESGERTNAMPGRPSPTEYMEEVYPAEDAPPARQIAAIPPPQPPASPAPPASGMVWGPAK